MTRSTGLITDLTEWRQLRQMIGRDGKSVGFVPTMGALHAGHASLLRKCRAENDIAVLSIYVNPTQFDQKDDLDRYPQTLEKDRRLADGAGIDFILLPDHQQIYADEYRYKVIETRLSQRLCGAHRPGHFEGVLTVVMKLLNLVQPDRAYFGEKDHQQLQLIKGMVAAFFMNTSIVSCPTVREDDGLALSSRNVNLTPEARALAPRFPHILRTSGSATEARARLESEGFVVDYVEDIEERRFGAIQLGKVRLIDNVQR